MSYRITITAADMREINRSAILEIIRRESPIARSAIAERLDVSLPTVMRIVDDLIDEGFVRPQGSTEWSGGRRRPSTHAASARRSPRVLHRFRIPARAPRPEREGTG